MNSSSLDSARAAKARIQALLDGMPELAGVGITRVDDGYGVKVNLSKAPTRSLGIPDQIDGVPIRTEVVGEIRKRCMD